MSGTIRVSDCNQGQLLGTVVTGDQLLGTMITGDQLSGTVGSVISYWEQLFVISYWESWGPVIENIDDQWLVIENSADQ